MVLPVESPAAVRVDKPLVDAHYAPTWRYARFLGASPAQADDLVQEAFVRLMARPPVDRGAGVTASWLRTTVRRAFARQRARERDGVASVDPAVLEEFWLGEVGDDGGAAWLGALQACLVGLAFRQRHVLEMRYAEGLALARIGDRIGASVEATKSLLRRTRAALQSCIRRRMR